MRGVGCNRFHTYIAYEEARAVDTNASIGGIMDAAACVPVEKIPHGRKSRYDRTSQHDGHNFDFHLFDDFLIVGGAR